MRWSDIDIQPPDRTVRQFAGLWLLFCAGVTLRQALGGRPVALVLAAGGLGLLGLSRPAWLRPVYVVLTVVTFPVGWLVSHALLALLFFGIITPLALVFRLLGRDPLGRQ